MPVTALMFVAVLLPVAGDADTVARVTLIKDGAAVALTEPERAQIAERVRVLMVGCAISSVTQPKLFSERSLPTSSARSFRGTTGGWSGT